MINLTSLQIAEMVNGTLIGEHHYTVNQFSMNSRQVGASVVFLAYVGEKFDAHQFIPDVIRQGGKCIITKALPDYDPTVDYIIVEDTNHALLALARAVRHELKAKVIAVTGSNGKTTTKDILKSICETRGKTVATLENNNNEIGVAQTILRCDETVDYLVLEAGIDKLGDMDLLSKMIQPDVALLTSIGLAHVDHFESLETIAIEKCKLIQDAPATTTFFYQGDKPLVQATLARAGYAAKQVSYGFQSHNDIVVEYLGSTQEGISFSVNEEVFSANLQGAFQASNCAGAIVATQCLGFSHEQIQSGIHNVQLTALRLDKFKVNKAEIIMDAYKSNPESALAALAVLQEQTCSKKCIVFADMLGLGDKTASEHIQLIEAISSMNFDQLYFYGDNFKAALDEVGFEKAQWFGSFPELKEHFLNLCETPCCILIKGSRSFELERLLEGVK